MDWNNIISFIAGGLIAIIPVIVANRYQAREKDKDRAEQRREARIQIREKWIERDILKIMDAIKVVLGELAVSRTLLHKAVASPVLRNVRVSTSDKNVPTEVMEHLERAYVSSERLHQALAEIHSLSSSFEEFLPEQKIFTQRVYEFINLVIRNVKKAEEKEERIERDKRWMIVYHSAGKFHKALREKLISLRDS